MNTTESIRNPQLLVFDLTKGMHWPITSHGSDVTFATTDASGTRLRHGRPHGHGAGRPGLSADPAPPRRHSSGIDAVASARRALGRVVERRRDPPLAHAGRLEAAAPHPPARRADGEAAALALQVVEDAAAPTGYKLEIGPFPGWKDVPTW